ncbi:unnamed protein product [Angiostrongylus costaricensis]|uniref:Sodium/hydrogen exchanger n=1 Tax=Angiostrongylus costaricensis TaxID=334426 RepID=A0A158PJ32_ANGCS|nr:unnamed protein product [Angiostrongylus costaricensis]
MMEACQLRVEELRRRLDESLTAFQRSASSQYGRHRALHIVRQNSTETFIEINIVVTPSCSLQPGARSRFDRLLAASPLNVICGGDGITDVPASPADSTDSGIVLSPPSSPYTSDNQQAPFYPYSEQSCLRMRQRSASESVGCNGFVLKSILKKPYRVDRLSRSISESQNCHTEFPHLSLLVESTTEVDGGGNHTDHESPNVRQREKRVSFSEKVQERRFRSGQCILAAAKKNERKRACKKRKEERRRSLSGASDDNSALEESSDGPGFDVQGKPGHRTQREDSGFVDGDENDCRDDSKESSVSTNEGNVINSEGHRKKDHDSSEGSDRRVCCCFSTAGQYCNSIWKPFLHLPNLNSEEVVLLITGVIVIIAVFYGLNNIIKFATAEWGAEVTINGLDKHVSFELNIGIIKLLNSYTVGLYFCIYPVLLGLLDLNRLWYMSMRSSACRTAHTFVSMSATFLSVIPVTMFLFPSVEDHQNYLGFQFCILLYVVYSITALVQEIAPFFIGRNNDTPVWTATLAEKPMLNDNSESEQLYTAKSETVVETADALRVTPRPFVLDNLGEGVLSLENLCASDWITLRILVSAPRTYTVYPQKVIIPPQRNATVTVRLRNDVEQSSSREAGLMLQWASGVDNFGMVFPIGRYIPIGGH